MTTYYPAEDVAKAINAMPDYPKTGECRLVASWFGKIPVDKRAEYRALVEDHLMSLATYDVAERKIKFLNKVLRDHKITGFDVTPDATPLPVSEIDIRVLRVMEKSDPGLMQRIVLGMAMHPRLGEISPLAVLPDDRARVAADERVASEVFAALDGFK